MGFLTLFLALTAAQAGADPVDLNRALCGNPPADAKSTQAEGEKLHAIEKDMPPVRQQNPADWCYVFSATDVMDYYIHSRTGQPYSGSNQVSPIDAVAAERAFVDATTQPAPAHPGEIGLHESGNVFNFLAAMHHTRALRSLEEIDFTPADFGNPRSKIVIDSIYERYKRHAEMGGTGSCTVKETDPAFVSQLTSFQMINQELFNEALSEQLTDEKGTTIEDYSQIAAEIDKTSRAQKITIPPFEQNLFDADPKNPTLYLSKISEVLAAKSPVSVTICGYDLPGSTPAPNDSCGQHAMTVVGEGWVGGVCMIRLRNSWGKNWGSDTPPSGYIDWPVAQFMKASQDHSIATTQDLLASWISKPGSADPASTKKVRDEKAGEFVFEGELYPNGKFNWGILTKTDGSSYQYKDGQVVAFANNHNDDGSTYTGTVKANGSIDTGSEIESDHSISYYERGQIVRVENFPIPEGLFKKGGLFTGTVKMKDRKIIPDKGKIQMPNGSVKNYP